MTRDNGRITGNTSVEGDHAMTLRSTVPMAQRSAIVAVLAAFAFTPTAAAADPGTALPELTDGHGLTIVDQPEWVADSDRTFVFSVATDEVPTPSLQPGQDPGEHDIMITLPEDYDPSAEYPVLYSLHGNGDRADSAANRQMGERATRDEPVITVWPNGGRSWYSNWVNPGDQGPQNWETFHLDQLIPFIDDNLATDASREGRAIAGHSMGGFGAFHYAQHRPELFSYVGSFSGGLDLLSPEMRAAVVATTLDPASGVPTTTPDAIFGSPVWPFDGVWNAQSPAQNVEPLRGMGVAMYAGNGGDLTVNPIQAVIENRARQTAVVTSANLTAAGIPHDFLDYGDGSEWAPGCTGKHSQIACLQADLDHFVALFTDRR
ncbi:alpha/beta hydrolase-fold protein [Saccharomonospora sp. NPDC006951]